MEKNSPIDFDLLRNVVPGWKEVKDSEIESTNLSVFDPETAGLYRVTYKGASLAVTYRKLVNEELFKKYRYPSENGIGPKTIYSKFPILIQEFVEGAGVPGIENILKPKVYSSLFRELVKFHQISIAPEFSDKDFLTPYLTLSSDEKSQTELMKFDKKCTEAQNRSDLTAEEKAHFSKVHQIMEERDFILKIIKPLQKFWCHCDLHESNLLWNSTTNKVTLIDFEDSAVFFRGFDLANLLSEIEWDIIDEYPKFKKTGVKINEEDERRFLMIYTLHWIDPEWESKLATMSIKTEDITPDKIEELLGEERQRELFEKTKEEIAKEYAIGRICSSYFWTIWNVLQFENYETDEWGFLGVANFKFELYFEAKKRYYDSFVGK